jgi:uncharacterized protein YacL
MVSLVIEGNKLNGRLENLLNQFEKEVRPYDRLSSLSVLATPIGVVISIFLPFLLVQYLEAGNAYTSIISGPLINWIIAGMLMSVALTKLPLLYVDHKKHEISRNKYKPVSGVCMCDLSQLRSHISKMEKSRTIGERMRHAKLIDYYTNQIEINKST